MSMQLYYNLFEKISQCNTQSECNNISDENAQSISEQKLSGMEAETLQVTLTNQRQYICQFEQEKLLC
ncbi:MAG: hypothetical protein IMZ53_13115 [Thermoplasmata archaeon]|nr:hypothetical protein [Thermoplasmata archaeon]